jgi:hypothetical protein
MDSELICSNNSLGDLIKWSKIGYIIILNGKSRCQFFSRPEYKLSNKIVQINLSRQWDCLMDEGEWPSYLIEYGCKKMSKEDFTNIDFTNIQKFKL